MADLPAGIAAEAAMLRANVALSSIKKNADAEKQIANLLEETILNVPAASRGGSLNIKA